MNFQKGWLIYLLFAAVITTLVAINLSFVQGSPSASVSSVGVGENEFKGPSFCVDCHPGEVSGWADSKHARAYSDPAFQDEFKGLGSPSSCLGCHTTAFNATSGSYIFEGVTCEQCHGPGNTMNLNLSVTLCATCHSGPYPTYEEWLLSGPGHGNATCNFCHSAHPLELRTKNATSTCAECHKSHLDLWSQSKHGESKIGCENCHMYRKPAEFEKVNGTVSITPAVTGHSFFMTPQQLDCTTCHNQTLVKHNVLGVNASACLSCHGEIHGLQLRLVNGTVYPIDQPVALCGECHNDRFVAWERGTHGSATTLYAPCTECHNPHDPIVDNIATIVPVAPREPAAVAPIPYLIALAVIIEILFLLSIYLWGGGHG